MVHTTPTSNNNIGITVDNGGGDAHTTQASSLSQHLNTYNRTGANSFTGTCTNSITGTGGVMYSSSSDDPDSYSDGDLEFYYGTAAHLMPATTTTATLNVTLLQSGSLGRQSRQNSLSDKQRYSAPATAAAGGGGNGRSGAGSSSRRTTAGGTVTSTLSATAERLAAALLEESKRTGKRQTVLAVLKSFTGTGVLFLPRAFANGGWFFTLVTMLFTFVVNVHCMRALVQCCKTTTATATSSSSRNATPSGEVCTNPGVSSINISTENVGTTDRISSGGAAEATSTVESEVLVDFGNDDTPVCCSKANNGDGIGKYVSFNKYKEVSCSPTAYTDGDKHTAVAEGDNTTAVLHNNSAVLDNNSAVLDNNSAVLDNNSAVVNSGSEQRLIHDTTGSKCSPDSTSIVGNRFIANTTTTTNNNNSSGVRQSYGEIGYAACGRIGTVMVDTSIVISQLGFCAVYGAFIAANLQDFMYSLSQCNDSYKLPLGILILAQFPLFVPLCWIRRLKYFAPAIITADVCVFFGLTVIAMFVVQRLATFGIATSAVAFNPTKWPIMLGVVTFLWEGIGLVLPVRNAMKERHKAQFLDHVLVPTLVGILCVYLMFATTAYFAYGAATNSVILFNLPGEAFAVYVVQTMYVIAVVLTYPLQFFPASIVIERQLLSQTKPPSLSRKWTKNLLICLLIAITLMFSYYGADQLDNFVAIIGALCCLPLAVIYPSLFHFVLSRRGDLQPPAVIPMSPIRRHFLNFIRKIKSAHNRIGLVVVNTSRAAYRTSAALTGNHNALRVALLDTVLPTGAGRTGTGTVRIYNRTAATTAATVTTTTTTTGTQHPATTTTTTGATEAAATTGAALSDISIENPYVDTGKGIEQPQSTALPVHSVSTGILDGSDMGMTDTATSSWTDSGDNIGPYVADGTEIAGGIHDGTEIRVVRMDGDGTGTSSSNSTTTSSRSRRFTRAEWVDVCVGVLGVLASLFTTYHALMSWEVSTVLTRCEMGLVQHRVAVNPDANSIVIDK